MYREEGERDREERGSWEEKSTARTGSCAVSGEHAGSSVATNNTGMYLTSVERQSVREGDSMTVQSLRQKTGHAAWHTFRPSFSAKS